MMTNSGVLERALSLIPKRDHAALHGLLLNGYKVQVTGTPANVHLFPPSSLIAAAWYLPFYETWRIHGAFHRDDLSSLGFTSLAAAAQVLLAPR